MKEDKQVIQKVRIPLNLKDFKTDNYEPLKILCPYCLKHSLLYSNGTYSKQCIHLSDITLEKKGYLLTFKKVI